MNNIGYSLCNGYLRVVNNDIFGDNVFDIFYMMDLAYFLKKIYPNCLILIEERGRKQSMYFDKYYLIERRKGRYYLYIDNRFSVSCGRIESLLGIILEDVYNNLHVDVKIKEIKTSLARGYVKVGEMVVEDYLGNYGKGYKVFINNPRSTQYCLVNYYILEEIKHEEN